MRRILIGLVVLLVLVAAGLGVAAWRLDAYVKAPVGVAAESFVVPRGASLRAVLEQLREAGIVAKPRWVYLVARVHSLPAARAGEYAIEASQSPLDILAMLAAGRVKTESFTIPEGLNRWQVRELLVAKRWLTAAEFNSACDDAKMLERHQVPGPSCEGYLFPETYTFARGVSPEVLFGTFYKMWRKNFEEATKAGRGPSSLSPRELMTLASIVEKETGAPEERPRIACVFYNRLQAKPMWRLETDPTVIYAATLADPSFDGNLKRSHLRQLENPYNTYKVVGLPPGPIASPGRAAMNAVVSPETCPDFFFVSMNNGKHIFCPTYACHLKEVERWQVQYFRRQEQSP